MVVIFQVDQSKKLFSFDRSIMKKHHALSKHWQTFASQRGVTSPQ
jgi:hypothetical protein